MFLRSFLVLTLFWCVPLSAHADRVTWYQTGHKTASGMPFSRRISASNPYIAAHRHKPFGMRALVTNLSNGRQQCVSIQDRGPYANGATLDLTHAAAAHLDFIEEGVARNVRITWTNCYIPAWALASVPRIAYAKHARQSRNKETAAR